jgi:hypothetical protein
LNTVIVLEPVAEFVPALHGAVPVLLGIIDFGEKFVMAVQVNAQESAEARRTGAKRY